MAGKTRIEGLSDADLKLYGRVAEKFNSRGQVERDLTNLRQLSYLGYKSIDRALQLLSFFVDSQPGNEFNDEMLMSLAAAIMLIKKSLQEKFPKSYEAYADTLNLPALLTDQGLAETVVSYLDGNRGFLVNAQTKFLYEEAVLAIRIKNVVGAIYKNEHLKQNLEENLKTLGVTEQKSLINLVIRGLETLGVTDQPVASHKFNASETGRYAEDRVGPASRTNPHFPVPPAPMGNPDVPAPPSSTQKSDALPPRSVTKLSPIYLPLSLSSVPLAEGMQPERDRSPRTKLITIAAVFGIAVMAVVGGKKYFDSREEPIPAEAFDDRPTSSFLSGTEPPPISTINGSVSATNLSPSASAAPIVMPPLPSTNASTKPPIVYKPGYGHDGPLVKTPAPNLAPSATAVPSGNPPSPKARHRLFGIENDDEKDQ